MIELISPPSWYLPPSREEIKDAAKEAGLRTWSPALVQQMANFLAGGSIIPLSEMDRLTRAEAARNLPQPDPGYGWRVYNRSHRYTKDRQVAVQSQAERSLEYHRQVGRFLEGLDQGGVPGGTPLKKALNILKMLATQPGGKPSGEGEDPLPIFLDTEGEQVGDHVARHLNEVLDTVDKLDKEERELLQRDSGSDEDAATRKVMFGEDLLQGKEEILRISRTLDDLTQLKVVRQTKMMPDPQGVERQLRPIKELAEVAKATSASLALPRHLMMYQAVTGQLPIREKVSRVQKKQLLVILMDCSGSMDEGSKVSKAGGVLMNRLKAVVKGEAELAFSFFDSTLEGGWIDVRTPQEAKRLMLEASERSRFNGRSTRIDACVREGIEFIHSRMDQNQNWRPELLVITDGDDSVRLTSADARGIRTHVALVEGHNDSLEKWVKSRDGLVLQL